MGSPSSRAAVRTARSFAVVDVICKQRGLPNPQVSPQQIKKRLCGVAKATKEAVENACREMYPELNELYENTKGVGKTTKEHAFDAVAACVTCLDGESILMARQMATAEQCAG